MKGEEKRDNIEETAYWWPTDDPYSWSNMKQSWLLKEADRLRFQRSLTSLGAGVLVSRVHVSSEVAYGVAPYQGLCVLALALKERASELIRN
jgi:hypothetical protein